MYFYFESELNGDMAPPITPSTISLATRIYFPVNSGLTVSLQLRVVCEHRHPRTEPPKLKL